MKPRNAPSSIARAFAASPTRQRTRRAVVCQALERRQLLSTIDWTNKGTGAGAGDTDGFNAVYGANAATARNIVQRAIDDWERVIVNFNYTGGGNTFSLDLSATVFSGGLRGQTSNIARQSSTRRAPISADILLDDNAGGNGWYFDPSVGTSTIPDDSEFTTVVTPFDADNPATTGFDFYRTTLHELGHAMGLLLNTNGFLLISDFTTSLGINDPLESGETLFGVNTNGGASDYTLTSSGGGHFFEGSGSFSGPEHPNELMNAGRAVPSGTRRLISPLLATLLDDVYGYTVASPNSINSFWANLNRTTNVLTINGDINTSGSDNDSYFISVVGTDLRVSVGGIVELIPIAEFTTLVLNAGAGNDTIFLDSLPAGKTVTINGGADNDNVILSDIQADLDTGIDSDILINGGTGIDSVRADDQNDGAGSDTYTINGNSLTKGVFVATLAADMEQLTVNGSNQPSTWNITGSTFNLLVNAGTAADTFNVGGGDVDTNLVGLVTINGGAGVDRLDLEDATDGVGSDTWTFAAGSINKGGQIVTYNTVEGLVINASAQANVYNLNAQNTTPVTVNGGSGSETFLVGNGDLDTNIDANVTLNGGGGTDSVTFNDATDGAGGNVYTLTSSQLNKGGRLFNYTGFESLTITGSTLAATYNINGSSSANTIINGGAGIDTVNVGGGDLDTNLGSNITVNGGGGADILTIDDSLDDSINNVATFTSGQIVKGLQTFVYNSFAALTWTGAAFATTYNVNGTVPGTPVTINGGAGNDTVNVGGGDFDTLINGDVRINGGNGVDRVVIDDTADQISPVDTYNITGGSFTKDSAGTASVSFGGLFLGSAPTIDQFVLNASNGASTINVSSTGSTSFAIPPATPTVFAVPTTINGGDGADVINVTTGNLGLIRGNLVINAEGGADSAIFNDSADAAADTFSVSNSSVTNSDWDYTATFNSSLETLTLEAGTAANTINYTDGGVGPVTNILNGNGGADTFNIIEGTATVHGGAGLDNVVVNETAVGGATAVFDQNEDLGNLYNYEGGATTVSTNGQTVIDAQSLGFLRGTLNLNNNTLISRTSPVNFLVDKLARGYNAGAWNGVPAGGASGVITSATAAASTLRDGVGYAQIGAAAGQLNVAVFGGVNVNAGNVVITYTLNGDANLDRTVNFSDLVLLGQNYNLPGTNWVQGNFNYDTGTNFTDLVALGQNYNQSVAPALPAPLSAASFESASRQLRRYGSRISDDVLNQAALNVRGMTRAAKEIDVTSFSNTRAID